MKSERVYFLFFKKLFLDLSFYILGLNATQDLFLAVGKGIKNRATSRRCDWGKLELIRAVTLRRTVKMIA